MKPSNHDVSLCRDKSAIIACVSLYYGDELCRQRYRKQIHSQAARKKHIPGLSASNPLKAVNFNVKYLHEELCVGQDGTYIQAV